MKKILITTTFVTSILTFAQNECDNLKTENSNLKANLKAVNTENDYLKKVLDINTSILENQKGNSNFKITNVSGNAKEKSLSITFLIEAKDENKKLTIQTISIVDLEGNEYKADLYKSSRPFPDLALNVPLKLSFSFKDIINEPLFIKLFKFNVNSQPERNTFEQTRYNVEFRDLKVIWN